jgi:hypothetical protein
MLVPAAMTIASGDTKRNIDGFIGPPGSLDALIPAEYLPDYPNCVTVRRMSDESEPGPPLPRHPR